jgi:hypothetical protein
MLAEIINLVRSYKMTITYEKYTSINETDYIRRFNENASYSDIPLDPANSDYQAYLAAQATPIVTEDE